MADERAVDAGVQAAFCRLVEEYTRAAYGLHPLWAAIDGWHEYDRLGLGRVDAGGVAQELGLIQAAHRKLEALPLKRLGAQLGGEAGRFAAHLDGRKYELAVERRFARDPSFYTDLLQEALLFQVIFDSPAVSREQRLEAVLRLLDDVPGLAQAACGWMEAAAPELLEYGLESLEELRAFIANELPGALGLDSQGAVPEGHAQAGLARDAPAHPGPAHPGQTQPDAAQAQAVSLARLERAGGAAVQALQSLEAHLRMLQEAQARSPGTAPSFALGESGLAQRLRLVHGLALPQERPFEALLRGARAEIESERAGFEQAAAAIDPRRPSRAVWAEVQADHPQAGQVVQTLQGMLEQIAAFLQARSLVELPLDERVELRPAPRCLLHWYASLWQSGPFEPEPLPPAIFYISDPGCLPQRDVTPEEQEQMLRALNRVALWSVAIHEAYPGHFVQGHALRRRQREQVESGTSSWAAVSWLYQSYAFEEGWAHYTEQMLREEGFLDWAPAAESSAYRMAQRAEALLRLCRTVAGIELHCGRMSLAQAADLFEQQALLPRLAAETEALRGVYEPDYVLYSLGKLAILEQREAERQRLGAAFELGGFHEALLRRGSL